MKKYIKPTIEINSFVCDDEVLLDIYTLSTPERGLSWLDEWN